MRAYRVKSWLLLTTSGELKLSVSYAESRGIVLCDAVRLGACCYHASSLLGYGHVVRPN